MPARLWRGEKSKKWLLRKEAKELLLLIGKSSMDKNNKVIIL